MAIVLILFHFAIPFCLLLSRGKCENGIAHSHLFAGALIFLMLLDFYCLHRSSVLSGGAASALDRHYIADRIRRLVAVAVFRELAKRALVPGGIIRVTSRLSSMAEEHLPNSHTPAAGNGGPGYETRDVNVRGAAIFGDALFTVLVIVISRCAASSHISKTRSSLV